MTTDKLALAIEALTKLERAATRVHNAGATTGPQWTFLSVALVSAREDLSLLTKDQAPQPTTSAGVVGESAEAIIERLENEFGVKGPANVFRAALRLAKSVARSHPQPTKDNEPRCPHGFALWVNCGVCRDDPASGESGREDALEDRLLAALAIVAPDVPKGMWIGPVQMVRIARLEAADTIDRLRSDLSRAEQERDEARRERDEIRSFVADFTRDA